MTQESITFSYRLDDSNTVHKFETQNGIYFEVAQAIYNKSLPKFSTITIWVDSLLPTKDYPWGYGPYKYYHISGIFSNCQIVPLNREGFA